MRKKSLSMTDRIDFYISMTEYQSGGTNSSRLSEYKNGLRRIIDNELTERQRFCFCQRYYNNRSAESISDSLGISKSAVYNHLRKAMNTVKKFISVYGDVYFK